MEGLMSTVSRRVALAALVVFVAGCGGRTAPIDGGPPDAHSADAAASDAVPTDAAPMDADFSACPVLEPTAYGDCANVLGAVFDGRHCVPVSGCDCGADCAAFFPTVESCATGCAAVGRCNTDKFRAPELPLRVGYFCDLVEPCGDNDAATLAEVLSIWPTITCGGSETYCICPTTLMCYAQSVVLDEDLYRRACAITLLAGIDCVSCTIFL
jgi:hypothetical protein